MNRRHLFGTAAPRVSVILRASFGIGQGASVLRIGTAHLRRLVLVGAVSATVLATAACTPQYRNHGYIPLPEDLNLLSVGVDTRETVTQIAGTPTSGGVLNQSGFYYVASRFRHFGPLEPAEIEREVLAISFDTAGKVSNIERFGLEQGQVVTLSRRVTDDNIQDITFLSQLLGSIGQFDAGALFGDG